ncbi:phosphotransferase family protein [Nocardia concava]|uniref:phosphotransferase family protein n=1 Tax=Nocardia concava TaxID=257281 RepID=UPI0007C52F71|nr:phosphotransferase family protein [Nocardia concava]
MAVPLQRSPASTRDLVRHWLSETPVGAEIDTETVDIAVPSNGFSAETWQLTALGHDGYRRRLVIRVGATGDGVYPTESIVAQAETLRAVRRHSDVPVPAVLAVEPDPGLLGAPFFLMEHVAGRVPPDFPSYHRGGWVADLVPSERTAVWWSALTVLERLHTISADTPGLPYLGPAGPAAQVRYWTDALDFYGCAGDPVIQRARRWLTANLPVRQSPYTLLWGDARLGNIIYDGTEVAALVDWEMAGYGEPESDLAWFLYLDRNLSSGIGAPRLYGLPDRQRTVEAYAALSGRSLHNLEFYEVLAGFKFALITAAVTRRAVNAGLVTDRPFPLHRNAVALLDATLEAL